MGNQNKEKGYALIIVLFTIIFITIITAVFMRGALSNIKQETAVDESNLTVVAAESGVDYYSWLIKNKYKEYLYGTGADKGLIAIANERFSAASVNNKNEPKEISPAEYKSIQNDLTKIAGKDLRDYANGLIEPENEKKEIIKDYTHKLLKVTLENDLTLPDGKTGFKINGTVAGINLKGETPSNRYNKKLEFEQLYIIPNFESGDSDSGTVGAIDIPEPKDIPLASLGELNKSDICNINSGKIMNNQKCYLVATRKDNINQIESTVFIDGSFEFLSEIDIKNGLLVVDGKLTSKDALDIDKNSKVWLKSDLKVTKQLKVVQNNILRVGGILNALDDMKVTESDVWVGSSATVDKQMKIEKNSSLRVGGALIAKDDLKINKSIVWVGGSATVTKELDVESGSSLGVKGSLTAYDDVKVNKSSLVVGGAISTPKDFKIEKGSAKIAGSMSVGKEFKAEKSSILIGGALSVPDDMKINKSKVVVGGELSFSKKLKVEGNSKLCVGWNLVLNKPGELEISDTSRVIVKVTSALKNRIPKVDYITSQAEYDKECSLEFDVSTEQDDLDAIELDWRAPVIEKVEYLNDSK